MTKLWSDLAGRLARRGEAAWLLGDVLAGLPTVRPGSADEYLPQMLNLELIGGVDFNKGCYSGQEIVARTHYRGKVKRRMYLGGVESDVLPTPGTAVVDEDAGQPLGKIVEAVSRNKREFAALVVVNVESAGRAAVHLSDTNGPRVHLTPFDYMQGAGGTEQHVP